jgi:hypothetical protein
MFSLNEIKVIQLNPDPLTELQQTLDWTVEDIGSTGIIDPHPSQPNQYFPTVLGSI